jgi:hypothetical protein
MSGGVSLSDKAESALERRRVRKIAEMQEAQRQRADELDAIARKRQEERIRASVHKASTAKAHKRPPPILRRPKSSKRATAVEMLSAFMGTSVELLHAELHAEMEVVTVGEDGNPVTVIKPDLKARRSAARYVIDKVAGAEGTYVPGGINLDLSNEDVISSGSRIIELVVNGQLAIEAAQKVFGLLQQQAQLNGLNELEELKAMVARMSGEAAQVINGIPGSDNNPTWMRLTAGAPKQ